MSRKALIIANPGAPGASNYCKGVAKDVENYKAFLRSPTGGLWYEHEITVLNQPGVLATNVEIVALGSADYSVTIFCGHGHHSVQSNSTQVELKPGVDFDSNGLRRGAPRHTLILDCCRVVAPTTPIVESLMAKAMKAESEIHPQDCRKYYDEQIAKCPTGLVVLFACSVGQTAGDSETQGGYYSYNLLDGATQWVKDTCVNTANESRFLSIVEVHEKAKPGLAKMSAGRQVPVIEKPRSGDYFPFCIIS